MAVYVSESERPQLLPQILAQVFSDIQRRRAEERSFANQERLLGKQFEMERPTREAQLANLSASTDALRTGAENQTKTRTFEEEKFNTELFLKNTIGPLLRANNIERANQLRAVYGERNSIVKGMPDFDMTDATRATGAADKWAADRATEAASGSQNPIAVDLARKLSTNEALAGPQFGYQVQAEQGPEAVAESAAIASDRAPGATPRLQAKTQKEIQGMADAAAASRNAAQIASQERVASARADANGAKPLSAEASKVLAIAQTIQPEIEQMKAAFRNNYRGALAGMTSGTNRELVKLRDNIADKLGRLRSGGAINKDEEARFIRQIGGVGDLAFGDAKSAESALDGILGEARQVEQSITGARGGTNKTVTREELRQMGATEAEAALNGYTVVD